MISRNAAALLFALSLTITTQAQEAPVQDETAVLKRSLSDVLEGTELILNYRSLNDPAGVDSEGIEVGVKKLLFKAEFDPTTGMHHMGFLDTKIVMEFSNVEGKSDTDLEELAIMAGRIFFNKDFSMGMIGYSQKKLDNGAKLHTLTWGEFQFEKKVLSKDVIEMTVLARMNLGFGPVLPFVAAGTTIRSDDILNRAKVLIEKNYPSCQGCTSEITKPTEVGIWWDTHATSTFGASITLGRFLRIGGTMEMMRQLNGEVMGVGPLETEIPGLPVAALTKSRSTTKILEAEMNLNRFLPKLKEKELRLFASYTRTSYDANYELTTEREGLPPMVQGVLADKKDINSVRAGVKFGWGKKKPVN